MSIFSWDGISEEDLRKEYDLYLRENSPTASPYYNQDLIVNMDYIGINNNKANKQGWERNAKKYWEAMLERYPNAFSSSNRFLIENYDELKVSPKCDQTFIDYFGVNMNTLKTLVKYWFIIISGKTVKLLLYLKDGMRAEKTQQFTE